LEVCWTGTPTISYAAALRRRFQPIGIEYVPRARCVHCRHVQETSVAVIHQQRGLIHLPLLHCNQGRWVHPISVAAFVRRRIPAQEHTDPATCPEFAPAAQPIPAVEDHRLRVNRQAQTRRATGE
jgi:hypothetical protein